MPDLIVHVEAGEKEEARDLELAQRIQERLQREYPNHYWIVSFTGHALVVRHALITSLITLYTGREGFGALLPRESIDTVHHAEATALKFAGALLEAFKLPRDAWDGERMPTIPEDLLSAIRAGRALRGWR